MEDFSKNKILNLELPAKLTKLDSVLAENVDDLASIVKTTTTMNNNIAPMDNDATGPIVDELIDDGAPYMNKYVDDRMILFEHMAAFNFFQMCNVGRRQIPPVAIKLILKYLLMMYENTSAFLPIHGKVGYRKNNYPGMHRFARPFFTTFLTIPQYRQSFMVFDIYQFLTQRNAFPVPLASRVKVAGRGEIRVLKSPIQIAICEILKSIPVNIIIPYFRWDLKTWEVCNIGTPQQLFRAMFNSLSTALPKSSVLHNNVGGHVCPNDICMTCIACVQLQLFEMQSEIIANSISHRTTIDLSRRLNLDSY